ncbi:MAG: HAD-IIB family hydrolase [Bacillus sp. (in: Bacteria)]|nr:HAD-IIB family hydrolase [Bacillus sp. (in: firmicutes)]
MNYELFRTLPEVENPKYIMFSDFDETYFPHRIDNERKSHILALEEIIFEKSKKFGLIFGLVTGSSIEAVIEKMRTGGFNYLPHFIASDLGAEIRYFSRHKQGELDLEWIRRFENGEFHPDKISEIIAHLATKNITLDKQPQMGVSKYKHNYYYFCKNEKEDQKNLQYIRQITETFKIGKIINKCNPLAGDPENAYDIDFIPLGTGKGEIVNYILAKFNVDPQNGIAFGDSGNDLHMLQAVKHGYLLENATNEAKLGHGRLSIGSYSEGILNTLNKLVR